MKPPSSISGRKPVPITRERPRPSASSATHAPTATRAVRQHPADRPAVALLQRARARVAGAAPPAAPRGPVVRARAHCATTAGISVIASTSESSTATASAMANERKNSPTTPVRSPSGAKTTTVVRVEPATGPRISSVPVRTTSAGGSSGCSASRRSMFSTTTTASSMMMPIATASPPRLIRLSESPASARPSSVMATVSGRLSAAAAVVRHSPRKRSSTSTASAPPISIASRTLRIESRTSAAWSYTDSSRTPAGSSGRSESIAARTAACRRSVLPFGWREMLTSAAGRPLPATIWKRSCGAVAHGAQVGHADRPRARSRRTTTRPTASGVLVSPETTMAYCR